MKIIRFIAVPLVLAYVCGPLMASAHEIRPAIVTVTFKADGRYLIDITANMEAVLAGISPVHSDTDESPNAQSYNQLRALSPADLKTRIQNFAIIDSLELNFAPGFNVITGETGAGKSIIIDAVELLLGGRAYAMQGKAATVAGVRRVHLMAALLLPVLLTYSGL